MRVVNQITFTAKDDAEALRLASERLGRDAVILSTQVIKEGGVFGLFQKSVLKVTAGLLEDDSVNNTPVTKKSNTPINSNSSISSMDDETRRENLIAFQKLMEFKERSERKTLKPTPPKQDINSVPLGDEGYNVQDSVNISEQSLRNAYNITPAPIINKSVVEPVNNSEQALRNAYNIAPVNNSEQSLRNAYNTAPLNNDATQKLTEQVGALADKLDFLLQRITAVENQNKSANFQPLAPAVTQTNQTNDTEKIFIEQRLKASGVDEKYIAKLLADYSIQKEQAKTQKLKITFNKYLAQKIDCSVDVSPEKDPLGGRKIMLIGPTGVGKTTTIAKLAAIKALWEHKKVLLLTSDTYRIAAVEQLKTYAKILGVPLEIVFDTSAIPAIIEAHDESDIILLDTAGRSQRDRENMKIFENLFNAFTPDSVHLVLAANMKYEDMLDVVEHIPAIPISHLLFTKLDETISYGSLFNIQQVIGTPISFLTVGQNVPKDIEIASGSKIADFLLRSEDERKH